MLVNARCLHTKFDAGKNVCMVKFHKRIIDALLKIENEPLPPKSFILTRKRCSTVKEEGEESTLIGLYHEQTNTLLPIVFAKFHK